MWVWSILSSYIGDELSMTLLDKKNSLDIQKKLFNTYKEKKLLVIINIELGDNIVIIPQ